MGRAQLQHVLSIFLRMRNTTDRSTGRSVDDIHTNRVGIDLASTGLAALAPITAFLASSWCCKMCVVNSAVILAGQTVAVLREQSCEPLF